MGWFADLPAWKSKRSRGSGDISDPQSFVHVNSYSGYKADEYPLDFTLAGKTHTVKEILARWRSPDATFFRIHTTESAVFVLRCSEAENSWSVVPDTPLTPS